MYRVALIQNESEMMRYSWSDIRPTLTRSGYLFDSYTADNLDQLFPRLAGTQYDALLIATNACNDKLVRQALDANAAEIEKFVMAGKGLLVSFQMRMADLPSYAFLPEPYRLAATNRIRMEESPKDGSITYGVEGEQHPILRFPHTIDLAQIQQRCLANNLVEGIYWIYLTPLHPEHYAVLVQDTAATMPRSLLLSSREDGPCRIVVSALAMDWQQLDDLWDNTLRFVVEGRPSTAIIRRSEKSDFDFRYLLSSLQIRKVPYTIYEQPSINPDILAIEVHDTVLLDPAWSSLDVQAFVKAHRTRITDGKLRVLCFTDKVQGQPAVVAFSNVRDYQLIARNGLTWLLAQYPDNSGGGYWAGSFWCTLDVLTTLRAFGMPIDQYKDRVLAEIAKHDRNGSYDEVLGATCAMYEIFTMFGVQHTNPYNRTLPWITTRVAHTTLFERATAYDTLIRLGERLSQSVLVEFKDNALSHVSSVDNEIILYRYAKTLLTCGFLAEAEALAHRLGPLQGPRDGKWISPSHTAAVVDLLMDIQHGRDEASSLIDEMLFRGIEFLRNTCVGPELGKNAEVSAVAKSLKALRTFEHRIHFPVDVVMSAVESSSKRAQTFNAIETATRINQSLQIQLNKHAANEIEMVGALELQKRVGRFASGTAAIGAALCAGMLVSLLHVVLYIISKGLGDAAWTHIVTLLKEQIVVASVTIVLLPLIFLGFVLKRLRQVPRWLQVMLPTLLGVDEEVPRPEDDKGGKGQP